VPGVGRAEAPHRTHRTTETARRSKRTGRPRFGPRIYKMGFGLGEGLRWSYIQLRVNTRFGLRQNWVLIGYPYQVGGSVADGSLSASNREAEGHFGFSAAHDAEVWVGGCMDVWMYGCMDVWMYGCRCACGCVSVYMRVGV
jgi:hypothetical protein